MYCIRIGAPYAVINIKTVQGRINEIIGFIKSKVIVKVVQLVQTALKVKVEFTVLIGRHCGCMGERSR